MSSSSQLFISEILSGINKGRLLGIVSLDDVSQKHLAQFCWSMETLPTDALFWSAINGCALGRADDEGRAAAIQLITVLRIILLKGMFL